MRIADDPANVAFVKPSTVVALFCALNAAQVMPVKLFGISAVPIPFAIVTLVYTIGFAWFTNPMYNFSFWGKFPDAVNVIEVGGVGGAVAVMEGEVMLRDGRMARGRSCGHD